MKTTVQTLNDISKKYGDCSDYRIAKMMNVTRSMVSMWRTEKNTMSEKQRIKAAELLHQEADEQLLYGRIERAKNTDVKNAWMHTLKRLNATAAAVVLAVGLWIPSQDVMAAGFYEVTSYTLCALLMLLTWIKSSLECAHDAPALWQDSWFDHV